MRKPFRLLACSALVGGASLVLVIVPAGIAGAKPTTGTCTGLNGNASSQTLSGCNQTAVTGGSGTSTTTSETVSGKKVTGDDSVTWASGGTNTETFKGTLLSGTKDKCVPGAGETNLFEVKETGKVTGGTGVSTVLDGGKTKGTVCTFTEGSNTVVTNFPGTLVTF